MDIVDFITRSNEAETVDQLYQLLEQALQQLCGYDRVIFSLVSDHSSIGLKAGHGIMRNYPDDWMKQYVEKGYEHLDPVRRFGFRHVGPYLWDTLPLLMDFSPQQSICMKECRESGFFDGAAMALRGLTGELGGIGVACSHKNKGESERDRKVKLSLLNAISHQFYMVFCNLYAKESRPIFDQIFLTSREVEVMQHMARAKKDETIAFDLHLSKHAVDFHVRNILKKFKAPNRMHAVMKAVNSGFVCLEDAALIRGPY